MPRLEHLPEIARNTALTFPAQTNAETPWTPLRRPLSQARVALVTTAGLHLRGDTPFVSDHRTPDQSYRRLPSATPTSEIVQSHTSIGFDRTGIQRDLNVTYPVDRLRELVRARRHRQPGRELLLVHGRLADLGHPRRRHRTAGGRAPEAGRG